MPDLSFEPDNALAEALRLTEGVECDEVDGLTLVDEGTFAGRLAARLCDSPLLEMQFVRDGSHELVAVESIGNEWLEYRLAREDGAVADELSLIALDGVFNIRVDSRLLRRVRMARIMMPDAPSDG